MTSRFEAAVAELAAAQHGVVSRSQLLDLGLGYRATDHRIARGLLHPIHRGVYAVGHRRVSREGSWMAAVLAAGAGAVLSYRVVRVTWRQLHANPHALARQLGTLLTAGPRPR